MSITITPQTSLIPEAKVLWWPLWERTGTTTGSTTPSGFGTDTGTTRTGALTLTVATGSVAWTPGVGFSAVGAGTAYLERTPSGDAEEALYQSLFDLSAYEVGQSILIACDLTLPTGWTAASGTSSATIFWAGDSSSVGWGIETSSGQNLRPHRRPQGAAASASGSVINEVFSIADGRRTFIVQLECTAANVFKMRAVYSANAAAPTVGAWVEAEDFSTGGTDGPNFPSGSPLRVASRKVGATGDRYLRRDAVMLPVWIAGFSGPVPDAVVTRALGEMLVWRGILPRIIRTYRADDSADYVLDPSGLADATFSPITLADMFVNVDGSRALEDHPDFSIITEPKAVLNSVAPTRAEWQEEADIRGLYRITTPPGGYKMAQSEQSPGTALKPVFLLSCSNVDQSPRNRTEFAWRNNVNTRLPRGERIWHALRFWHDFDFSDTTDRQQHVLITQWYHGADNAGLNPCMGLTLYGDRFSVTTYYSTVEGMTKADQIKTTYTFPGLSADMRNRFVDLVITGVVHWDAAENPWFEVYMDDQLLVRHEGPNCYKGPALYESLPVFEELRVGPYPGSNMTTITPRNFQLRRFFVARNTQGYTLAQIRAALQG
ncbi:MAG: Polysaccharide lyase [Pseudomonadota bacterium]